MFKYRVGVDFRETTGLHHIFLMILFLGLAGTGKFIINFREDVEGGIIDAPRYKSE
jgi:hypothetical protein